MISPKLVTLMAAWCPLIVAQQASPAMSMDPENLRLTYEVSLESERSIAAFRMVLRSVQRPGGVAVVSTCLDPARRTLRLSEGAPLPLALDTFVSAYPMQSWKIQDGVIDLLPKGEGPSVLGVIVRLYEWDITDPVTRSVGGLFLTDDISKHLSDLGLIGGFEVGLQKAPRIVNGVPEPPAPGQKWKIENVTLLTALNKVVASYGIASWWYEERRCGNEKTYRFSAN